jgi:hypothetical protein
MANKQLIFTRFIAPVLIIVIAITILFFGDGQPQDRDTVPVSPERKTILNATMTPVDGAPDGTYIIEYSNGNKEVLHPDGSRVPLVVSPEQSHHDE